jgi:hypothetical protein
MKPRKTKHVEKYSATMYFDNGDTERKLFLKNDYPNDEAALEAAKAWVAANLVRYNKQLIEWEICDSDAFIVLDGR